MDEELYHYGIKGMKWGIRRTDAQLGHKIKTNDQKASDIKARVRENVQRGKSHVDAFLKTPAGRATTVAAMVGLSYVGLGAFVSAANFVAFGQSPLRTLGLDDMDSMYEPTFELSERVKYGNVPIS